MKRPCLSSESYTYYSMACMRFNATLHSNYSLKTVSVIIYNMVSMLKLLWPIGGNLS